MVQRKFAQSWGEDNFVNFGLKEACCNFVKKLYNFINQIDLDQFGKKLIELKFGKKKLTWLEYEK